MQGRAEPIRLLLAYTKQEYTNEHPTSREDWVEKREKLGLEVPDLPYLVDGDFAMSESGAILQYVAERSGDASLVGEDVKTRARVQMVGDIFKDIIANSIKVRSAEDKVKALEELFAGKTGKQLSRLDKMAENNQFLTGKLTIVDFVMFIVRRMFSFFSQVLKQEDPFLQFKNLLAVLQRFEELPGIKEYLASEESKRPFLFSLTQAKASK